MRLHTPLPWRYSTWSPRGGVLRHGIGNKDGSGQVLVGRSINPADAKLIVASVNAVPKVKQKIQMILRLHDGKPKPCRCFHCDRAREIETILKGEQP